MSATEIPPRPTERWSNPVEHALPLKVMPNAQIVHGPHHIGMVARYIETKDPAAFRFYKTTIEQAVPTIDALEELYRACEFSELRPGFEHALEKARDRLRDAGRTV